MRNAMISVVTWTFLASIYLSFNRVYIFFIFTRVNIGYLCLNVIIMVFLLLILKQSFSKVYINKLAAYTYTQLRQIHGGSTQTFNKICYISNETMIQVQCLVLKLLFGVTFYTDIKAYIGLSRLYAIQRSRTVNPYYEETVHFGLEPITGVLLSRTS